MDMTFPVEIRCSDGSRTYADQFGQAVSRAIALALETGREYALYNRITDEPVIYIGRAETKADEEYADRVDTVLRTFVRSKRDERMAEAVRRGIVSGQQGTDLLRLWNQMDEAG